jgi:hypothetical protein
MTRGRCGSLFLKRMKLSFTTPCRFNRRTETIMKKKLSVKARVAKRCNGRIASIITHISETIWAIGTSAAAAMVISSLTH